MDIGKYAGYFHDGDLNAIIHKGNNIEFLLESSVIDPDEDVDKAILSSSNTLKGSLLLCNIKNIKVGNKEYKGILQKQYDDGEILDLEVENNKILLLIEWTNFPPKIRATDVSKIEIEAEKVQWIPEKSSQVKNRWSLAVEMRKIKKYNLDYEKTIRYFIGHIKCGKTLSQKVIEKIDFRQGNFFTFLPANAELDRLYAFSYGGIIPAVSCGILACEVEGYPEGFLPQQVITMDQELSEFIANYTKKSLKHCAVVENVIMEPGEKYVNIKKVKMTPYKQEVYYILNRENSIDQIYQTIRKSSQVWHFLSILTLLENAKLSSLENDKLDDICKNAKFVVVGAYDGEGYVFWEEAFGSSGQ